jgi:hypothetical protein
MESHQVELGTWRIERAGGVLEVQVSGSWRRDKAGELVELSLHRSDQPAD